MRTNVVYASGLLLVGLIPLYLFGPQSAFAGEQDTLRGFTAGDVLLRGRISGIYPFNIKSTITGIGGNVEVPKMVMPDVDISYFFSDSWSVTAQTGINLNKVKIKNTAYGDIDVGTVWVLPLSLVVDYHIPLQGRLKPYIGAGVLANWYFGENPAGNLVQSFKVPPIYAPLVKVGVDYQINEKWFANAEIKGIALPKQAISAGSVTATTSANLIMVGVGLSYRF